MENVSDKSSTETWNTHITVIFFSKIVPLMRCRNILYRRAGHTWQYGASDLHAGYLRLQTHTQYMCYLLIFHCKNGCTKVPEYYVISVLHVLLNLKIERSTDLIVEYCNTLTVAIIITSYRDSTHFDIYCENRLRWFEHLNILLIPPHNTCTPQ